MKHNGCRPFDRLMSDVLEGSASLDQEAHLRRHLSECVQCSERWNRLVLVEDRLREVPSMPVPPTLLTRVMATVPRSAPATARRQESMLDRVVSVVSTLGAVAALVLGASFVAFGLLDTVSSIQGFGLITSVVDYAASVLAITSLAVRLGINTLYAMLEATSGVLPLVGPGGVIAAVGMVLVLWRILSRYGGVPVRLLDGGAG